MGASEWGKRCRDEDRWLFRKYRELVRGNQMQLWGRWSVERLLEMFGSFWPGCLKKQIWRLRGRPEECKKRVLEPMYRNKGDVQYCSNSRGLELISHTIQIWERVVKTRLGKTYWCNIWMLVEKFRGQTDLPCFSGGNSNTVHDNQEWQRSMRGWFYNI